MKIKFLGLVVLLAIVMGCETGSDSDSNNSATNQAGSVAITGTLEVGEELTAVLSDPNGTFFSGSTAGISSIAWFADGVEIIGASELFYTLTAAELGAEITVAIAYEDNAGFAESVTSDPTAVVTNAGGGGPTSTLAAVIRDTNASDTGELRYDIPAAMRSLSGRLVVSFTRTSTGPDAFIALLNSTGSTSSERAILDLRIKDDEFEVRDQTFAVTAVTPTPGTVQEVVVEWDAPTLLVPPTVTVTIDGVPIAAPFTAGANATGGVERVQFRFGDNGNVSNATDTFTITEFEVFGDTAGTMSIFADDFSGFSDGDSLDDDNPLSPYNGSTSEAVVEEIGGGSGGGGSSTLAAVIRDTNASDTGELRYDLPAAQLSGRLEVSYDRTATGPDAFISLLNSTGSTSSERSILDLRIKTDEFQVRDQTFSVTAVTPTPGTVQDVVVEWTAPDASTPPTVTVTVDGIAIAPPFTSGINAIGGVERVQFRFGDNSGVSAATDTYTITEFEVFSDTAGTTSVFADDFSGFSDGDSLDDDNPASPYNGSTSEAVVEAIGGGSGGGSSTLAAVIRDTNASDTGELRYDVPAAQLTGRLEVSYDRTATGPDAFISLLNSTGSTSSERSILDLRIKTGEFQVRDQTFSVTAVTPTPGTVQDVVVEWTAPDAVTPPTVTVTVDGIAIAPPFTSGVNAIGGVERVQFRFGDNSGVSAATDTYTITEFEVFSDTAGTTSVFADDFTGFSDGDSLDDDNPASPYNGSTSEAVVEAYSG